MSFIGILWHLSTLYIYIIFGYFSVSYEESTNNYQICSELDIVSAVRNNTVCYSLFLAILLTS